MLVPPEEDPPQPEIRFSLHAEGDSEAKRQRWLESEKAKCDLGERAIMDWVQRHWTGFCRAKWLEHLHGQRFWVELPGEDFGLLPRRFPDNHAVLSAVLDQLMAGKENLDILNWAMDTNQPRDLVFEILMALDVNSIRLRHRFDAA